MSDNTPIETQLGQAPLDPRASTVFRLCEELIALRERNHRQHTLFERKLSEVRDELQAAFNRFAADSQRAYQQLRQEVQGEKRVSLTLFQELLEVDWDLEHIVAAQPAGDDGEALRRWAEAVGVESRKVHATLERHGIYRYDAVVGSAYNPALHERVSSRGMVGMEPLRIAEQVRHGYASQQPEFVLRRPQVIITE